MSVIFIYDITMAKVNLNNTSKDRIMMNAKLKNICKLNILLALILTLTMFGCGRGGGGGASGVTTDLVEVVDIEPISDPRSDTGSDPDGDPGSGPGLNPGPDTGNSVTLSWDAPATNSDGSDLTDLAGYKVHYGTSSNNYTQSVDIGNSAGASISSLSNETWCFAVTAYDTSGNESDYSQEVCI
jgi:hypothetical protein